MSSALFVVLLVVTLLVWLVTVALSLSLHQSDAAGNGLSFSFAIIGVIVTWSLLGILVAWGFTRVARPSGSVLIAALAFAASAAAAITIVNLLNDDSHIFLQWPVIGVILPPLLMLAFAAWTSFPSVQRQAAPRVMFTSIWIAMLLLSVVPFPLRVAQTNRLREQRAAFQRDGGK